MWDSLIQFFSSVPEFILEAVLSLIITIIGGVIVAYFVSRFFERINEVTRLKGLVIEKRIEIYKELARRLESFNNLLFFRPDQVASELLVLNQIGYEREFSAGVKINDVFNDNESLNERYLDFENFALENRLFFDTEVYDEVNFLQNYLCLYTHIQILYNDQLIALGKDFQLEENKKILNHAIRAVGIMLSDDFSDCITKAIETIRKSLKNVSLKTRHEQLHTYDYYNNPEGEFMQRMTATTAGKSRENIFAIVYAYALLAK